LPRLRAGLFFLSYLALYAVSQFIVFFARGSEPVVDFLGTQILKQAQWTAIIVLLLCIPLYFYIMRASRPWPHSPENPVPWGAGQQGQSKSSLDPMDPSDDDEGDAGDPVELTPWQPARAVGGALRNVFIPTRASGETDTL
jgi:phosphatidylglycerol:prolipoprotein diacylglycerol transferase